jgi:hypothetical protein
MDLYFIKCHGFRSEIQQRVARKTCFSISSNVLALGLKYKDFWLEQHASLFHQMSWF